MTIPERRQWRRSSVSIVNFEHVIAGWVNIRSQFWRRSLRKQFILPIMCFEIQVQGF